jgi:cell wall-associated NlpC family hydrolase
MGKIVKSAASLVTGVALAVSVTAVAEVPASAATTCSASFRSYSTIKQGSRGPQTKALECLLHSAGFSTTVNGSFSSHDASQLAKFRSSVGLHPLKIAGRLPWAALLSRGDRPTLHKGAKGSDVLRLQRALQALGWTKVDLDGLYGTKTATAVKAAQKQRHLSQTGTANASLWRALQTGRIAGPAVVRHVVRHAAPSSKGAKALAFAKKQIGDSYRFGATGPNSWDCSGLTSGAWKAAGVRLPRTSRAQYGSGKHIAKSDLRAGDLVFFYSGPSHVAIYAGGGKVIHAPRPGKSVEYIKMSYMPYKGARRPS